MKSQSRHFIPLALALATLTVKAVEPGMVRVWGFYVYTNVPVAAQSGVMAIASGDHHTVALKTNGEVLAWGDNNYGQTDVPVAAQSGVMAIAAAFSQTVALKSNGTVLAWGRNGQAQTNVPAALQGKVRAIAAGGLDTGVVKTNGEAVVWGYYPTLTNVPVAARSGVTAIAITDSSTAVALKATGTLVVWGFNQEGQTNVPVAARNGVMAIAAGNRHIVALKTNGTVVAWGMNQYGQTNVPVAAQSGVIAIGAGDHHSVALKTNGTVVAWGLNDQGQTNVPVELQGRVKAISAGFWQTVAIVHTAPAIVQQPLSQSVVVGTNVTLNVAVTGLPLYFQWFKNGVPIPNATQTMLTFNPVAFSDAGNYLFSVSNTLGRVTSSNAVLAVRLPGAPIIRVDNQLVVGSVTNVGSATVTMESGFANGIVYYTLDGSTPDFGSPTFSTPIIVSNTTTVRALGLNADTFETAEAPTVTVYISYPVTATTAGGGSVAVSPAQSSYWSNSVVSVSATASNGWTFLRWSGDASGTNNPLSLTVNAPQNLAAVFGTTVGTSVVGSGVIELNATNPIPYGTVVRASAIPNNGSYFAQWGSALTGTVSPAEFAVVSTNPVRAVFGTLQAGQVALSLRVVGAGSVDVTPRQQVYTVGDSVTLTATPLGATNQFNGWSGDALSAANPLVLMLNTSKVVTANFSPIALALRITQQGSNVELSWPVAYSNATLLSSPVLTGGAWLTNSSPQTISGSDIIVTLQATNSRMFYRLGLGQ